MRNSSWQLLVGVLLATTAMAQQAKAPEWGASIAIGQKEFRTRPQFQMVVFRGEPLEKTARLVWVPKEWYSSGDVDKHPPDGYQAALYRSSKTGLCILQTKLFEDEESTHKLIQESQFMVWFGSEVANGYYNGDSETGRLGDTVYKVFRMRPEAVGPQAPPLGPYALELLPKAK